jgi:hypothetical protein
MPTIAKKIHREDQIYPGLPATCGDDWPAATSPRINAHRVHRKRGGATVCRIRPRQSGSFVPGVCGGSGALHKSFS